MLKRIMEELGEDVIQTMSVESARKIVGWCDTSIGKMVLRHLDREEFYRYETDVGELNHNKSLYNKGYIHGIRSVRSLFQHAYMLEMQERERLAKQKGSNDGSN